MKKIYFFIFIILLYNIHLYSQDNNDSLENKMNNYKEKVKLKWQYNPLRIY